MLRSLLSRFKTRSFDQSMSRLFDQDSFYKAFVTDLHCCQSEVVIESPFLTIRRVNMLLPTLQKLRRRGVNITINTKPLGEQDGFFYAEGAAAIKTLQSIGVQVLFTGGHHRKLAVLDRSIVYEGSLNILSQYEIGQVIEYMQAISFTAQDPAKDPVAYVSFATVEQFRIKGRSILFVFRWIVDNGLLQDESSQ